MDIAERLRKLADRERPYGSLPDVMEEAADEIQRLREALREIDTLKLCTTMIVERGLSDPCVNKFIISTLQPKETEE